MPRGGVDSSRGQLTDTAAVQAFQAESMSQYGIHANADEMIRAHRLAQDPAVMKASLIQINPEETEKAVADLGAVGKKVGIEKGEEVIDAAVRGNAVIAVVQDEEGNVDKRVAGWTDDYKAPKLTPLQAQERAELEAHRSVSAETARLREEGAAKLAEAAAEVDQWVAAQMAKINEAAQGTVADAMKDAEKAQPKRSSSSRKRSGSRKRGTAKRSGTKRSGTTRGSGAATTAEPTTDSPAERRNETQGTPLAGSDDS